MTFQDSHVLGKFTADVSAVSRLVVARREELLCAYDRIDELEGAVRGMLGLIQLLSHNDDIPKHTRETMLTSHRFLDAWETLQESV